MWNRALDIFPGEWVGTEHELELEKELNTGDTALVIVDSQFQDADEAGKLVRRIGQVGKVIEIDTGDEWSYCLEFPDGINWFKRYHLQKQ